MTKSINQIKKELGIGNRDIAHAFGYKNANSFATSHRRNQIENGIEWVYEQTIRNGKRDNETDNQSNGVWTGLH
jgi:hypothetical protein